MPRLRHFLRPAGCALALALGGPAAHCASNGFTVLKSFTTYGREPMEGLIEGPGGYLYGTTYQGGANQTGTVFRLRPDGSGYSLVHTFGPGSSADGNFPRSVIVGADGALYGTTDQGGPGHTGTVFKVQPDGSGYVQLHVLSGGSANGARPLAGLARDAAGTLYGTTFFGGAAGNGTVFRINPDGTGFSVLHSFTGAPADGVNPTAAVLVAPDGFLYGVAQGGGAAGFGIIYRIRPDGTGYAVLRSFLGTAADGGTPKTRLIRASNGALYGTTPGVLYRINPDGTGYAVVKYFDGAGGSGTSGEPGLIQASDGALYGTTQLGGAAGRGTLYKINLDGTGHTVVRSFLGGAADGWSPYAPPLQASDGTLYGSTRFGGPVHAAASLGAGTLYKVNPNGTGATTLLTLSGFASDGATPTDGLIEATDGALYGTTSAGAAGDFGTVIKIQPDGTGFAVVHAFTNTAGEGATPGAGVMQAADGALYGVTAAGGTGGAGTVYRVQRDGTGFTTLRGFTGAAGDGATPRGRLVQASDGVLYGTTSAGGATNKGTVYKLNPDGTGYAVLRQFAPAAQPTDGANPLGALVVGTDGALYGTTQNGGAQGAGTIFRLQRDGSGYATLHAFTGASADEFPRAGLLQGLDGALYGTTYGFLNTFGGASLHGSVFRIQPDGSGYTVLHTFAGGPYEGGFPAAPLLQAPNGVLYGATSAGYTSGGGGALGNGSLFRLNPDGSGFATLVGFTGGNADGSVPTSLVRGSGGVFHGLTAFTASGHGLLYRATLGNNPPVAASQAVALPGPAAASITLGASDPDAADALTYTIVTPPAAGSLTGTAPHLTYIPAGGFTGTDTLRFVVHDGASYSNVATITLTVGTLAQVITFPPLPDHTFGDAPFVLGATASSGLPVALAVMSGPATLGGGTLTITGAGSVTVQATQAGNATYGAAPPVTRTFQVARAPAIVVLGALAHVFDGTPKPATASTTPSGLATLVTYNGGATAPSAIGSHAVSATVTDPNYLGSATGTLTISAPPPPPPPPPRPTQRVEFRPIADRTLGDPPFALHAAASSGLPIAFSILSGPATVSGSTLTMTGSGYVIVVATQPGDATYPAASAAQGFTVLPGTASIRLTNLSHTYDGTPKSVAVDTTPAGLATLVTYDQSAAPPTAVGTYTVSATIQHPDYAGSATATLRIEPAPRPPVIIRQPQGGGLAFRGTVLLAVEAGGDLPLSYQWFRDGSPVPGATATTFTAERAGSYRVEVRNPAGRVASESVQIDRGPRLANLSTRAVVAAGGEPLLAGFAVAGPAGTTKRLLIRAVGPGLAAFGVTGVLARPQLTVHSGAELAAGNTGWDSAPDPARLVAAARAVGAFPLAPGNADSALLLEVVPGNYTLVVRGADQGAGDVLAEVYELEADDTQLVNLSTRLPLTTANRVALTGLVVRGETAARVLIRAVGPGLAAFGVSGVLARPQLSVQAGGTEIAANTGWGGAANAPEVITASAAGGAFPLAAGAEDSAVVRLLAPGAYTIHVTGGGNATGVVLIEAYQVP